MAGTGNGEGKPKNGWGGARPGAGRPKKALAQLKERAQIEGLIWARAPELVQVAINCALNGDAAIIKELFLRLFGMPGNYVPIFDRLPQIVAALPEGWTPEAMFAEMDADRRKINGPWTTATSAQIGREMLEVLWERGARGDTKAAQWMAAQWIGDPVLSLGEQAASMTPEQLRETMIARYTAAWPWLEGGEILRMVDAISGAPKPEADTK